MNKFERLLGSSTDEMTMRRAKRMSEGAADGYANEVSRRKKDIRNMEAKLDSMMDISASPDRNMDNRAVDFDGDKFIEHLSTLTVAINVKRAELKVIEEEVGSLFSDEIHEKE